MKMGAVEVSVEGKSDGDGGIPGERVERHSLLYQKTFFQILPLFMFVSTAD